MVPVKGKLHPLNTNRVMEGDVTAKTVGFRKFKIYADNDKVKPRRGDSVNARIKSESVVNNGCQATATNSKIKGVSKNVEKSKGTIARSVMINTRRKVLADISNVQDDAQKIVLRDGAKPLKTKTKITMYSQRSSIGTSLPTASSSSSKPLMGKSRASLSQATGNQHAVWRGDKNDLKISFGELRTNSQGRNSSTNVGRTSLIPRPPSRNSLPVLKQLNKAACDIEKGCAKNTRKVAEQYGFSVKPKVGRKILPPGSSSGSHFTSNQARDNLIKTSLDGQLKMDSRASSRKLSTAKPKIIASDSKTTLKKIGPATLSKREHKVLTSLVSAQKQPLVVPCNQPAQDELPSDCNSNTDPNAPDNIVRKKSGRRRSYTSLLMETSKLLKEPVKITEQDFLPNIDDEHSHLDVAEYVDEIYRYYWVMEAHHQPPQNYMEVQKEITPHMRGILVNWLIEVHLKFDLMQETLYLMVTLLDKYLSLVSIKKNEMQLVGLTSLLLASKYEDFWHPRVTDLIGISAESYTRNQMLGMESAILTKLKFRLNAPTPYVFMLRFLKAAQSDTKFEHLAFYLIELSLVEYEAVDFKPSLLCASAIYLARCTLLMTPTWTPLLSKHAHYEESKLRDCAQLLLKFHKAAKHGMLKVTYEKFMKPDYSKVAAIKPLDRLPL